jgi:FkbM family methyltransferase
MNAAEDKRWTTIQTAVGATAGTTSINIAGNSSSSSILPMLDRHKEAAPHTQYVGNQVIQVRPLDQFALQEVSSAKRTILKIDTQGHERSVLDGAAEIVKLARGVQIELSLVPLYEGAMKFDEAIARLLAQGFELQLVEPGFRDPVSQQLLQVDGIFMAVMGPKSGSQSPISAISDASVSQRMLRRFVKLDGAAAGRSKRLKEHVP